MISNYLKIAWRNLWNNRFFTGLNLLGLALGLAVCLLMALYVAHELSYDRYHAHADDIYRVVKRDQQGGEWQNTATTPGPLAPTLKTDFAEVVEVARVGAWYGTLRHGQTVLAETQMFFADQSLLTMLDFPLLKGNAATALRQPNELVITERMARQYFGEDWASDPQLLGRPFRLNGQQDYVLAGVAQNVPSNSHFQFDVLLSFEALKTDKFAYNWGSNAYHTYVQLRPGASVPDLAAKLAPQAKRYNPNTDSQLRLQPLTDIYLHSDFAFGTDSWNPRGQLLYVRVLALVGLLVLVVAGFNFVNLATARSAQRSREVGIRKVAGAHRGHLVVQFMGEAFLLVLGAVGLAVGLAHGALPWFNQLTGKPLAIDYTDPRSWAFVLALAGVVGGLAGAYPALLLSSFQPVLVLKGILKLNAGRRFRQVLVTAQFAFCILLLVGAVGIYAQLRYIQQKDLGFDQAQLLYVRMGGNLRAQAHLLKADLQKLASVEAVAAATTNLVNVANESNAEWEGQAKGDEFLLSQMMADPDLVPLVGMEMAHGRNFSSQTAADTAAYLLNEQAAKRMGYVGEQALGKKVKFWGLEGTVIGVVKDFHFRSLSVPIAPLIVRYRPQEFFFNLLVKVRPQQVGQLLAALPALYQKYEAETPLQYGFVDQGIEQQYAQEQKLGRVILYFAGLLAFVACLGLFGLATFAAQTRTKEIGIRKVVGASTWQIGLLLSRDFVKLVALAFALAAPVAYYLLARWLAEFAYRVVIGWWMFALAGAGVLAVALLTVSWQSLRAALANPVQALRSE
jgi:putative ABC transport system permease protein